MNIYEKFTESIKRDIKNPEVCQSEDLRSESMLVDYIYNEYNTPMLTTKLSCCKYPEVSNLPYIWRDYLKPMMNFLSLVNTGNCYRILLRYNKLLYIIYYKYH